MILCSGAGVLPAQVHQLFHDDFTVETRRWQSADQELEVFQEGGLLHVSHSTQEGDASVLEEVLLRPREAFAIETSLSFEALSAKARFGLVWNSSERADRRYVWWMRSDGQYAIEMVEGGNGKWLHDWTRARRFKSGAANAFRLQKRGWAWYFVLNGKEILELPYKPFKGNHHGFVIEGEGRLKVNYVTIEHPPVEINVVDGTEKIARKARLDSTINRPDRHETMPYLSANRRSLYFTGSKTPWGKGDLLASHVLGDTAWSLPLPLEGIKPPVHGGMIHLNRRGNLAWMADKGQFIEIRRRADSSWATGQKLVLPGTVLGPLTYGCFSQEQDILVEAAERKGGYGEQDLYVSFQRGGKWTTPKNLGSVLNTYGRETSPWLAPDGETLYFSSEGHPGYGGGDVFRTKRLDNTWTRWSTPENLGPKINGPTWDLGYRPWEGREDRAYMASIDSIRGDFDLFAIRIPEDLRERPVVRVYGRLLHRKTGRALDGQVTALDLSPDSLRIDHETETGSYSFLLPYGKAYQFYGERIGYFATVDTLDVRAIDRFREIEHDLYLSPIEVGETITLERVFFQRASPLLLESSYPELDQLVMLMRALPGLEIEIQGHTDNRGGVDELQRLSEQRAETVREYLISHGITARRIRARGFGASQPIASNDNPATRALNRRVDFNILKR
ncbi:MAG: OmpA family protein [Bacteroidota bacterium]